MAGKTEGIVNAIKKLIKDENVSIAPTKQSLVYEGIKE